MTVIELDRKRNVLRIGNSNKDIRRYRDVTIIYNVSHVTSLNDGWYDIYQGARKVGHLTDVDSVQEKW